MIFINPIELLKLQDYTVHEIDSLLIKKAKRKLFADIDLSDDGLFDYKGVSLTKTDCETAIDRLENSDYVEFYLYLANSNQPLNNFLVNGDERFFSKLSQESIYKLPEFVNFISPYFAPRFDKALVNALKNKNLVTTQNILRTQNLINIANKNIAFRSTSIEIAENIKKTENITNKIKNGETSWTAETISGLLSYIRIWLPINILNILPQYFQSQINKIAMAINQLQLAIWDNLHNPSVCRQLLEHLLALNIESVSKQTFEKNFEIVKKADEKEKTQDKLQNQIDKLIALVNSFESKLKTIANAKELIYQAKPYLFNIKAISQGNDNIYISLSTRVASVAQNFVLEEVNEKQSFYYKHTLENAWEAIQLIGSLDLQDDFRINRYNPNKKTLQDICSKLSVATPQSVTGKMPQCNFLILDGTITHTDKNIKPLPITNPLIRGDIRYIGLNLKVETFAKQSVKFYLKYIQPNGSVHRGNFSPIGFTMSSDKTLDTNLQLISLSGWGNSEKSTYDVGTHHIEVWIDSCMIYRKSFVVDLSPEEKVENAKREAERRERERIEEEKRKEQKRIAEQKAKKEKIATTIGSIIGYPLGIFLAIMIGIWIEKSAPDWILIVYILVMLSIGFYLFAALSLLLTKIIKNLFLEDSKTDENEVGKSSKIMLSILLIVVIGFIIAGIAKICSSGNNSYSTPTYSSSHNPTNSNNSPDTYNSNNNNTENDYSSNNSYSDTEPTYEESPYKGNQLSNGSSPLDACFGKGIYNGNATLTIKNGSSSDAIVCLYSVSSRRTIRNEYVRKNTNFTMDNIAQGYYKIRVFYGNDWNPTLENSCGTKGNFESDVSFLEFDKRQYFEDSNDGYTIATITLYTVSGGNASTSRISQSDFFNN